MEPRYGVRVDLGGRINGTTLIGFVADPNTGLDFRTPDRDKANRFALQWQTMLREEGWDAATARVVEVPASGM